MVGGTGREPGTQAMVQQSVDELLSGSPALQALPDDRRRAIVQATAKVAQFIVGGGEATAMSGTMGADLVHSVGFPEFVRGLVDGVFHAVVDSSVEQMQAYGDLVKSVANQIGVAGQAAAAGGAALPDQEAVADAMLAGINRIATTELRARSHARHRVRPSEP